MNKFFLGVLLFASCNTKPKEPVELETMNLGQMIDKDVYYELPYSDISEGIKDSATIKDKKYHFVFDTGAPLCISEELQKKYHFPVLYKTEMFDSNGNKDSIIIVTVDTIVFAGIRFINIPAVVIDVVNSPIKCENVDGLIGSNIARFLTIQFDARNERIIFTDNPSKISFDKQSASGFILDSQSNAFLQFRFNESFTDSAHFDSGMGALYSMNDSTANQFVNQYKDKNPIAFEGIGSTNQGLFGSAKPAKRYVYRSEKISTGQFAINSADFDATPNQSRFGRAIFQYGSFTFDYPSKQFYYTSYGIQNATNKKDFGFRIMTENGKVFVAIVWEGSYAMTKGLKNGFEVLIIDGTDFRKTSYCKVDKLISDIQKRDSITMTYSDGENIKTEKFKK